MSEPHVASRQVARLTLGLVVALVLGAACRHSEPQLDGPPPRACTTIGCANGLTLALEPNAGWPSGRYEFELVLDGRSATCTGALPLPTCDLGPALSCVGAAVRIGESGCAMPPNTHGFSDVTLSDRPARVSIVIRHEGRELVRELLSPVYRRSQPNGPGCPPSCDSAHASLRVL
jgi:hypothetical protein